MQLYNTLTARKEEFAPQGDHVRMYVCGVTPYAPCHLGHAMSFIAFDTIRRYLEFRGYSVKYVQNFTDIDDKIIARANELGVSPREMADGFINQYFADMDALNVKRADIYPWATEEIPKIIEVIDGLVRRGHAYQADGDVYFRVRSCPDYGKLSHRNVDEMMAGARIEVGEAKQHPLDFALWKAAKPGEPQWQSPWGKGRPGWHIECSAMSLKYLGETLDIHGGGQDLIFPHHENEIAQSECFTGVKPFARYWVHNGLMQMGDDKMSKSTGKLITITEALERYRPDALRLWVLSSHYRSPIAYSVESLEAAERGVERLVRAAHLDTEGPEESALDPLDYRERFVQAMDDDFSTPQAVAALFDLARDMNRAHDDGLHTGTAKGTLRELAGVLGLTLKHERESPVLPPEAVSRFEEKYGLVLEPGTDDEQRSAAAITRLVNIRTEARRARKWELADGIRSDLRELGITLEDTPGGTVWSYRKP